MWGEIVSDLSVFHRIDDPLSLPSSRFFALAERLPVYGGAVAHAFSLVLQQQEAGKEAFISGRTDIPPGVAWVDESTLGNLPTLSGETLEMMQPEDRLPGIEYTNGS